MSIGTCYVPGLRALLVVLCGLLASCASLVPTDSEDLLQSEHRSEQKCFSGSQVEIEERVRSYLRRCHFPYTVTAPVGNSMMTQKLRVNWQVEERDWAPGGKKFFVRIDYGAPLGVDMGHGYTLGATVGNTQQCKAAVQVFAANVGWKNRFDRVLAAANGESPECFRQ